MNTIEGEFYLINNIFNPKNNIHELFKKDFETPIKSIQSDNAFNHYNINLDGKSQISDNSSEKYQHDQNLKNCLMNTLLLRLDQCSPVAIKDLPENESTIFDSFISSFSKRLDFNDIAFEPIEKQNNDSCLLTFPNSNGNCNRYNIIKPYLPKKKGKKKKKAKAFCERKWDWRCSNCLNINFGFRQLCNRCHYFRKY